LLRVFVGQRLHQLSRLRQCCIAKYINAKEKYAFHNRVEIIDEYFLSSLAGLGRSFF